MEDWGTTNLDHFIVWKKCKNSAVNNIMLHCFLQKLKSTFFEIFSSLLSTLRSLSFEKISKNDYFSLWGKLIFFRILEHFVNFPLGHRRKLFRSNESQNRSDQSRNLWVTCNGLLRSRTASRPLIVASTEMVREKSSSLLWGCNFCTLKCLLFLYNNII